MILRLHRLENSRLPNLCYQMMFYLNEHGQTNWCTRIERVLFTHGFGEVCESQTVGDEIFFLWTCLNRDSGILIYKTGQIIFQTHIS
jgi:hypothetical protein